VLFLRAEVRRGRVEVVRRRRREVRSVMVGCLVIWWLDGWMRERGWVHMSGFMGVYISELD